MAVLHRALTSVAGALGLTVASPMENSCTVSHPSPSTSTARDKACVAVGSGPIDGALSSMRGGCERTDAACVVDRGALLAQHVSVLLVLHSGMVCVR